MTAPRCRLSRQRHDRRSRSQHPSEPRADATTTPPSSAKAARRGGSLRADFSVQMRAPSAPYTATRGAGPSYSPRRNIVPSADAAPGRRPSSGSSLVEHRGSGTHACESDRCPCDGSASVIVAASQARTSPTSAARSRSQRPRWLGRAPAESTSARDGPAGTAPLTYSASSSLTESSAPPRASIRHTRKVHWCSRVR
jgi:hypothetical protein